MDTFIQIVVKDNSQEAQRRAREQELVSKIAELQELEKLIEEAKEEADKLKDDIKAEMTKRNTEEMTVGGYIVRWTTVVSNKFDSTAFKKVMPDVYKAYTKATTSKRFSVGK
jgi:predicted phage-related endonuclease